MAESYKNKTAVGSHEWLRKLTEDTDCPILGCDIKRKDLEVSVQMSEGHGWQWGTKSVSDIHILPIMVLANAPLSLSVPAFVSPNP